MKSENAFNEKWKIDFSWVEYDSEKSKMFCSLCRKHRMSKTKFGSGGSVNFKRSALVEHATTDDHKTAMLSETNAKKDKVKSIFEQVTSKQDQAMHHIINTAYYVAKENIPISKYESLCKLQLKNKTPLTSTLYQCSTSCMEFIDIISELMEAEVIKDIKASPIIGITVDESTDLSTEKHLIMYISYVKDGQLEIKYAKLIKLVSCDAVSITSKIVGFLNEHQIDKNRVVGFGSDGAAVMLGREGGVATLLKEFYPYLSDMHCSAHRLALACVDIAKVVPDVRYYESVLSAIYTYFKRSPPNLELLKLFQDLLEDPKLTPKEVHRVRWLSMSDSIKVVRQSYKSILHVASENKDSDIIANSLYNHLSSYKFMFLTHFYSDIFGGLGVLSKNLQRSGISYRDVQSSVHAYQANLEEYLQDNPTYGPHLQMFLDGVNGENDTFDGIEFVRTRSDGNLSASVTQLTRVFKNNLSDRFPDIELHSAFSVLAPADFPKHRQDLNTYGRAEIRKLGTKFEGLVDSDTLITEWHECKSKIFDNYMKLSVSELYRQLEKDGTFPNIRTLLAISLTLPTTSVDCERGFSVQNLIKTRNRCSITIGHLDQLMRIMILGPQISDFDPKQVLQKWKNRDRHIIFTCCR